MQRVSSKIKLSNKEYIKVFDSKFSSLQDPKSVGILQTKYGTGNEYYGVMRKTQVRESNLIHKEYELEQQDQNNIYEACKISLEFKKMET